MTLALLTLAGTVALLLWGVHMVQTGVQRALGAKLRRLLGTALRNRFRAFVAGVGVTAVLQSSTATGIMLSGLAAGGLVDLVPGLAVMLGANVGSTLIVQALSFDPVVAAPVLILTGVILFRRAKAALHDFGRVLIGLGLILMALHQFLALFASSEDMRSVISLADQFSGQPLIAVAIATAVTWALHSSVAAILVVMSLASQGLLPIDVALAFVIGANLGTSVNPLLEGAGDGPAAQRLPLGNLLMRLSGAVAALLLLPWLTALTAGQGIGRAIANFHTIFNLALVAIFLPLLTPLARLLCAWLPVRMDATDPGKPLYLDGDARSVPIVALGAAAREALRLADIVGAMLQGFRDSLVKNDWHVIEETKRLDDRADRLTAAIKAYVTALDPEAMSETDQRRVDEILAFSLNMEQAADIIDNNLLALATKKIKRGLTFSKEGESELLDMIERLVANTRSAASLFMTDDVRAARLIAREKGEFRRLEAEAVAAHFTRLRTGRKETAETSALHLDAVRDLKQVNAHIVAAAAYPVLKGHGELMPSRVRGEVPAV